MSGRLSFRGTIGPGIIGSLLYMPVGTSDQTMDLSIKRDATAGTLSGKEKDMNENTSTPLSVVCGEETNRRKQKHPQSLRNTIPPSPIHPAYTPEKQDPSESVLKKRKIQTSEYVMLQNGGELVTVEGGDVNRDSETLSQQFNAFKRLSSQRWETLRKENNALKQELSLVKNVFITYLKSQSEDKDAQEAIDALQNTYFVTDDHMQSSEKVILVNDGADKESGTIVNGTIKEQLKAALAEKQAKTDQDTDQYKSRCESLQKQVKQLQLQCDKLRTRMLPALSHETRNFLRWVLMTSEEADDLYEPPMNPYYPPLSQVDTEGTWRHINGAQESWRETPTESWKDGTSDRSPVDQEHLTPVSAHSGTGGLEDTELWPGTGVYVNSGDLSGYVENSHKNPAVLFHSLVKHFFTLDQLSRSVPYGPHNNKKCDKEILPENIVKAIEGYVLCCASQPGWKSWTQHQLRKAFSNKCTGARRNHIRADGEYPDDSMDNMSMMEWSTGSPSMTPTLVKKENL